MLRLLIRNLPKFWPGYISLLILPVALIFDPRVFIWARTFSATEIEFFQIVTKIGHATWMLTLLGCGAVGFYLLSRYFRDRKFTDLFGDLAQKAAFVFVSVAGAGLIASTLKYLIGRARPMHFAELGAYYLAPLSTDPNSHLSLPGIRQIYSRWLFRCAFWCRRREFR